MSEEKAAQPKKKRSGCLTCLVVVLIFVLIGAVGVGVIVWQRDAIIAGAMRGGGNLVTRLVQRVLPAAPSTGLNLTPPAGFRAADLRVPSGVFPGAAGVDLFTGTARPEEAVRAFGKTLEGQGWSLTGEGIDLGPLADIATGAFTTAVYRKGGDSVAVVVLQTSIPFVAPVPEGGVNVFLIRGW